MRRKVVNSGVRTASRFMVIALSVAIAGCTQSLVGKGLGGPGVTLVDTTELPGPQGQTGADQNFDFRIGPLDKLIIDVLGIKELNDRRVTVDGSGNISLPIAGLVKVSGLSLEEARTQIYEQLRAGHVRNPQVAVNMEESVSNFVTVDGQVDQPGNYPIISGMTLMRAVASARGATDFAQLREVVIHRNVEGRQMIALYDLAAIRRGAYADPILYSNDIIVVGDSPGRRMFQQFVSLAPLLISPLIAVLDNNR